VVLLNWKNACCVGIRIVMFNQKISKCFSFVFLPLLVWKTVTHLCVSVLDSGLDHVHGTCVFEVGLPEIEDFMSRHCS
jgi:hypothetical protein